MPRAVYCFVFLSTSFSTLWQHIIDGNINDRMSQAEKISGKCFMES